MKLHRQLVLLLVTFLAIGSEYGPAQWQPTNAIFPIADIARGAIGRIREIKKGIRQHIKERMCERFRQGRMYVEPCEQFHQKRPIVKEEVIIEEEVRHHRPPHRGGGGGGGYGRPPKRQEVIEETIYETQPSHNRPVSRGGGRGGGYGRPPKRPHRPKPKDSSEEEDDDYQVKPETVVKEMEDEGEEERKPPARKPLPGRRPNDREKQGRQTTGKRPEPRPGGKQDMGEPCQTSEGNRGLCMPATFCYSQYTNIEDYRANRCELGEGSPGICCPQEVPVVDAHDLPIRIPQIHKPTANVRFISLEDINNGAKEAQAFIQKEIDKERSLIRRGMVQQHGSMQAMHQSFFGEFDPAQFRLTKGGFISLVTTVIIMNKFKLTKEEARDGLIKYSIENTDLEQFCIKEPDCHQSKYRSIDGSCTSLQRPLWGKSNTAFERLLPPEYDDGLHEPRKKSLADGSELPSARLVSVHLARQHNAPEPRYTLMLMQWGQFTDHDLTLAASTRASTGQGILCCDGQKPINHHACLPILIPENDQFYGRFRQKCMHFVRNSPSPRTGCSLGHREQMNTLSQVQDGSNIYGSSPEKMKELRTFRDGKMKTSIVNNRVFLPFERSNASEDCSISEAEQRRFKCFVAGDSRVNEQPGLTMIHQLLLKEHNRIADKLKELNPNGRRWNDEILFQETRRIVAAQLQHITYNEWLPIVLGRKTMKQFNILPKPFGHVKDYNPRTNPNILNEFATAAYRFHSLIQGTFVLADENGRAKHRFKLHELFNNPKTMYLPDAFDLYLNGFTTEPAQSWDQFFTEEITNHLFEEPNSGFGMDLVALNIQRGRDHGLPGYNSYRKLCGLPGLRSFRELDQIMEGDSGSTFSRLYKHVDDIDLFIGGVYERALPDALVGPTFACIVAEQSRRSKVGDRFWYENGGMPQSFTSSQLAEIRKSSLAALICENADSIGKIQPLAFLRPGGWNAKIPCDQIAKMNLNVFKNEKLWNE